MDFQEYFLSLSYCVIFSLLLFIIRLSTPPISCYFYQVFRGSLCIFVWTPWWYHRGATSCSMTIFLTFCNITWVLALAYSVWFLKLSNFKLAICTFIIQSVKISACASLFFIIMPAQLHAIHRITYHITAFYSFNRLCLCYSLVLGQRCHSQNSWNPCPSLQGVW